MPALTPRPGLGILSPTALAPLLATVMGCTHPVASTPDDPAAEPSTTAPGAAAPCSGGRNDVTQTLLTISEPSTAKEVSWIEIEVQGPAAAAAKACRTLAERERRIAPESQGQLAVGVTRACSTQALAMPSIPTEFALLERRLVHPWELLPTMPSCTADDLAPLKVIMRRWIPHPTRASCEEQLGALRQAHQQAADDAQDAARTWLDQQLPQQQQRVEQACQGGSTDACSRQEHVARLLEQRRQKLDQPGEVTTPEGSALLCRKLP